MKDLFDLTGRVAVLTGASKGMGKVMAHALAAHGATVVISSRKQDQLDAAASDINAAVGASRVHAVAANAGRKGDLETLIARTHDLAGPIDIVIGNAGVNPHYGPISEIPDDAFEKIVTTNVQANLWLARLVVPDMIEKGRGSLIFTSSIGAFKPSPTLGWYGTSKLTLLGLVRNLALEFGPHGIRANAICPGVVRTDFARALWDNPEAAERATSQIPLRRFGEPEDFAGIATYLASDASSYMTGQALTVCGGTAMWT
ncbi:NAD(P)-dependent dehydrogenase (short-subunit alcohol dehydrogenase family) [Breoghania corrubedonensis]|uniref:NAD(P)-dependent dehydrogenase (Short-subunit alcohol dehydrogenase family) n=1 Tax=Breoghania corrubedonensis TaxID=665038 RepID=A0A2T5US55_9HYPH|nr:SDR family oxidoreductase [Breoghania corrubedonensis]PTW54354.1 NAD(P)-dependent dehydrogenase (short-subunit alcohol dehydrogenase family) [Breoghania corrubedonensis]